MKKERVADIGASTIGVGVSVASVGALIHFQKGIALMVVGGFLLLAGAVALAVGVTE